MSHEVHYIRIATKKMAQIKASIKKGREALGTNLYIRFHMMLMRYAYKTKGFIKGLYYTRLRVHFNLPLVGEDEEKDKNLHAAVDQFFDWDYEMPKEAVKDINNEFYDWMRKNDQAMADLERYYLLSYWTAVKENEKVQISQLYRTHFNKELTALDVKTIGKLHDAYKKRHRSEIREFRESKAQRIYLDLEKFTPLIKWLSFCFVIGGYIYAKLLYGHFGIAPGQFFLIIDYLTLSLDQIQPLMAAILGYIGGALHGYRRITTETRFEREQKLKSTRIYHATIISLFAYILLAHIMGWLSVDMPPLVLTVAVFAITHDLVVFIACRYFKNGLHASYVALFIIMFGASLYFNVEQKIKEVETGRSETNFEIVVQSRNFTEDNSAYIGSNSRYLFLKTAQDKVEVFRLNQVDRISFQKELD